MSVIINKSVLCGEVMAISSKSYCHRHIIAAAMANDEVCLDGVGRSNDIGVSLDFIQSIGAMVTDLRPIVTIEPPISFNNIVSVNMKESGSTLRFTLPILAALGINATVVGEGRLPERTIKPIIELLECKGVKFTDDKLPLSMSGAISGGDYKIVGNISSQFISGLLMALPLVSGDSRIILTTALESSQYVDMTIEVLKEYGINILTKEYGYFVQGEQRYITPGTLSIESDWSNASVYLAMGAVNNDITITGLNMQSMQGDRVMMDILSRMGAVIEVDNDAITVHKSELTAIDCSIADCPDLAPMIAFAMANARGVSRIFDVERLVIKESDRLTAIVNTLQLAGVDAIYDAKLRAIVIIGGELRSAKFDGCNDHRIVMLATCIALTAQGESEITGHEAISKSYPEFFEDIRRLGGNVEIR